MKNSEYWKRRFELLEQSRNQSAGKLTSELDKQFRLANHTIDQQINAWYGCFAKNNQITLADAKTWLSTKDLTEFKWDVSEYIKYGKEAMIDPAFIKQLENASARFHVSKLEALQIQTQNTIETLYGKAGTGTSSLFGQIYQDSYYHTAFELEKGFGVGWDIAQIDPKRLESVLSKPWTLDKSTFSDRLWTQKQSLLDTVHTQLIQNMILGKSPDDAIKAIEKKFNASKSNAGRLVMTESAYFANEAQKNAFEALDVEQYEVVETLDRETCPLCGSFDGEVFKMSDYEAGTTAPPFHPWCRGCTAPYFADDDGSRFARDTDDETDEKPYYVPSDMRYNEWKEKFIDGGSKDDLTVVNADERLTTYERKPPIVPNTPDDPESGLKSDGESGIIKNTPKLEVSDFPDAFNTKSEGKNTRTMIDYVNGVEGADPDVLEIYKNIGNLETVESNGIPFSISHGSDYAVQSSYRMGSGELVDVKLTIPKLHGDDLAGQIQTTLHEEMHLIDLYCRPDVATHGSLSKASEALKKAVENSRVGMSDDVKKLFTDFHDECSRIVKQADDIYKAAYEQAMQTYKVNSQSMSWLESTKIREKEIKQIKKIRGETIDYMQRNAMGGGIGNLEDVYDALSAGQYRETSVVKYGHGARYYASTESQRSEILANYGALSVLRPDLIDLLKADKPELVSELEEIIKEISGKVVK